MFFIFISLNRNESNYPIQRPTDSDQSVESPTRLRLPRRTTAPFVAASTDGRTRACADATRLNGGAQNEGGAGCHCLFFSWRVPSGEQLHVRNRNRQRNSCRARHDAKLRGMSRRHRSNCVLGNRHRAVGIRAGARPGKGLTHRSSVFVAQANVFDFDRAALTGYDVTAAPGNRVFE